MPTPKSQKQEKVVRMYTTPIYFQFLKVQARRRNVSVSQLCKLALYDYFNPRYIAGTDAIPIKKIDRTPRPKRENVKIELVKEFMSINIKTFLKPVGSFDRDLDFLPIT